MDGKLNFQNRTLYHGDNLEFLRGINSGTIHLIATDPPFNKGKDFHATPDSLSAGASFPDRWKWDKDVHPEWIDAIEDNWPNVQSVIQSARVSYGNDMGAFLCWLGVRLLEMHRILRDDGSIYLHIDQTAHAWVKCLMDAIFGAKNFRNEIIWRRYGSHNDARNFGRVYDCLLFYAKNQKGIWNGVYSELDAEYIEKSYRHSDERGRYTTAPLHAGGLTGGGYQFEYYGYNRTWRYPKERLAELENQDRIHFPEKKGGMPRRKVYLAENKGKPISNLWDDIGGLTGNHDERTGYPTQKPLALYERIIQASSSPGDIVLDPFCGCATTPVAAERQGRRWLGMDIWDQAHQMVLDRLEKEGLAIPQAKKRPGQLKLTFADITYTQSAPNRTDGDEIPVPDLKLRIQRPKEPWERMLNREIRSILEGAQAIDGLIGCAGCGRTMEPEFMELDHILPKSENGADNLTNRILLCRPCNGWKSNTLTMTGLRRRNNQEKWMKNRNLAEQVQAKALLKATNVRDNWNEYVKERS